jgi:Domain of Unknown Function (DUF1206)
MISGSALGEYKDATRHGVELCARAGYVAKAVVYATVGVLVTMTAAGFSGGRIVGTRSAIEVLRSQPFGQFILAAIVAGLIGFVIWRFVQTFADPENKGSDAAGWARRAGLAISGLSYCALAIFAGKLLLGHESGSGGDDSRQRSTATIMEHEWGIWVVGLFGIAVIGVGIYQGYRAYTCPFKKHWALSEMTPRTQAWSTTLSRFGIAARAVSFALVGWFFVQAAVQADPSEARGLAGALGSFRDEPYGTLWLAFIGLGFVCYGLYCALNSRYKRINP